MEEHTKRLPPDQGGATCDARITTMMPSQTSPSCQRSCLQPPSWPDHPVCAKSGVGPSLWFPRWSPRSAQTSSTGIDPVSSVCCVTATCMHSAAGALAPLHCTLVCPLATACAAPALHLPCSYPAWAPLRREHCLLGCAGWLGLLAALEGSRRRHYRNLATSQSAT